MDSNADDKYNAVFSAILSDAREMLEKRKLQFAFDYGAESCFWNGMVCYTNPEDLGLSEATLSEMERLCEEFTHSLNWAYPPDPGPYREERCAAFNRDALALYHRIVAEIGDRYEIIDLHKELHEDPDLDEYLKDPKGFKRRSKS